ncbi:hypothetical protein [Iningainema tapete]|uniref:Uncharacterized protein n=1 Tax=Iningainema tapete BLCC-T55 TaxID=2748662 RepID=A0A8J7C0X6_9CYAN|nr:hypothetical protein [Iningainema tapete]MBD2778863.1 hypothetical protein [Iningainema tapete BLCC-T55]
MAYSDFKTINQVKVSFDLDISLINLFPQVEPVEPSEYLKTTLKRNLQVAFDNNTEKARSELIIAPLLIEVREMFNGKVSLFSGRDFNVDATQGLNGFCDYILSASEFTLEIEAPVIAIVEAKNESTNAGLGQCIAEMVAAQRFNQVRDRITPSIYGAVTTGRIWRFLKLSAQTVLIDNEELVIENIEDINVSKILGILTEPIKQLNVDSSNT